MRTSLALLLALGFATQVAAATAFTFQRYQVILDRKPFGEPPAPPRPLSTSNIRVVPPPPSFTKELRMCGITDSDDFGIRVGIVNIRTHRSYFFRIGEVQDDVELVDADFEEEAALLRKGDEDTWIYLDGRTGLSGTTATLASPQSRPPADLPPPKRESYAERLRRRRAAAVRHRKVAPPKLSGDELKRHLQEYQMEVIRKGMPPLPIPLTREMDDQLVAEGVLPPAEEENAQ